MEPIGSTYSQPLAPGVAAGKSAGGGQRTLSESAGSKTDAARFSGVYSEKALEQKGLQLSDRAIDEFRTYSRTSSQNSHKPGETKKTQGEGTSAGGTQEKQDPQVQAEIDQLKAIEEKVKAHEAAHKSAGGTLTGPVSYTYTRGPDNKNYITGGEVPISVSPGKTPQETISRMQQVIQAALAPADPSPQDRAVAAQASTQQQEARQKLAAAAAPAIAESSPTVSLVPGNQPDSIVARDSQRAYGNPVVTGKQPEISGISDSAQHVPRSAASSHAGFSVFQPVSYYA